MEDLLPRQERIKRREKAQKFKKVIFSCFSCIVGIFVIIWVVSSMERLLNWNTMELVPVKYGVLEDTTSRKSVIIRTESPLSVPQQENVRYEVEEGQRVHAGALLLSVETPEIIRSGQRAAHRLYAPHAGTVSMEIDGLESVLTPGTIFSLNLQSAYKKVVDGTMAGDGQKMAAIKIVDNLSPVYFCFPGSGLSLQQGSSVLFRLSGGEKTYKGTIVRESGEMLVARLGSVPKELLGDRLRNIELITRRKEGLIVPSSSLSEKDGETGLYFVSGRSVQWTEVSVEGIFEKDAVVSGVKIGQEVVANPETI